MSEVTDRLAAVKRDWNDCVRCPLFQTRTQVVHIRGAVPCDIAFVGEGPGTVEDAKGVPFIGPSGGMMEQIIASAFEKVVPIGWKFDDNGWQLPRSIPPEKRGPKYDPSRYQDPEVERRRKKDWPSVAFLNIVGCIPIKGGTLSIPSKESTDACRPRMMELLDIAKPRAIVRVGAQAKVHLTDKMAAELPGLERVSTIIHPAAILRQADKDKHYKATVNELVLLAAELGYPF